MICEGCFKRFTNKVMDIVSGWIYYRESNLPQFYIRELLGSWQVGSRLPWPFSGNLKQSRKCQRGGAPIKQSFEPLSALVAQPEKPNASLHTRSAPSTMCLLMGIHNVSDQAGRGQCETSSNLAEQKNKKEYNGSFQLLKAKVHLQCWTRSQKCMRNMLGVKPEL